MLARLELFLLVLQKVQAAMLNTYQKRYFSLLGKGKGSLQPEISFSSRSPLIFSSGTAAHHRIQQDSHRALINRISIMLATKINSPLNAARLCVLIALFHKLLNRTRYRKIT